MMCRLDLAEPASALWLRRTGHVTASNIRLFDLTEIDDRLEAFVAALALMGEAGWGLAREELSHGEPAGAYVATVLALKQRKTELIEAEIRPKADQAQADEAELSAGSRVIAALAWERDCSSLVAIQRLRKSDDPTLRAIAIAAIGARRIDPGPKLDPHLTDPSPLVRARAYRTTGQLGRRDLLPQLTEALTDPHPECRFWSAWSAARMGADAPLRTLADIAWNNLPRAGRALDLLLRRLDVPRASAWLRDLVKQPDRQRDLIRATGIVGDPIYLPWLIERMAEPATARLAGEAFSMITGLDLAYRDLDRRPPADFQSGPNDDPDDENVALDEDDNLPWPDPDKIGQWWATSRTRFDVGIPYFLGAPKPRADWLEALSDAFQRQRHAAAIELAIRQPDRAMFEVRARGRLQRQLIARARGLV